MNIDPYKILGVSKDSTLNEMKSAFRTLAKKHHPDAGGDEKKILKINAAWEILKEKHASKLLKNSYSELNLQDIEDCGPNRKREDILKKYKSKLEDRDEEISYWIKLVYSPIDRLLGEVINQLPKQLKELSGDPYDDLLMDSFCLYIEKSQKKLQKIHDIYQSIHSPSSARNFALSLYQCFSEVQDALNELERYTKGYVDNYLHDGQEMIRIAKQKRSLLKKEKSKLFIN